MYDLNEINDEAWDQEEDTNRDKDKSRRNRHVWNRDKEHKVTEEEQDCWRCTQFFFSFFTQIPFGEL